MGIGTVIASLPRRRSVAVGPVCGLALAECSALPSGGPTAGQINGALKEDNQTGFTVVDIDPAITATLGSLPPADGGRGALARPGRIDTLGPRDVFEAGVTLFSGALRSAQRGQFRGDRVERFVRPRTVPVFGSTTKVSQVSFGADEPSMAEALARIGGPDECTANAPGKLATILGQLFSPVLAMRAVMQ